MIFGKMENKQVLDMIEKRKEKEEEAEDSKEEQKKKIDKIVKTIKEVIKKENENVIKAKWMNGKILNDQYPELKTSKKKQGLVSYRILAKKIDERGYSGTELLYCFRFADKFKNWDEVAPRVEQLKNWHNIRNELLTEEGEEIPLEPLPKGKYNIIYADPPWKYWEGGHKNQALHYEPMKLKQIKEFKGIDGRTIHDIQAENCILFLWATSPFLQEALDVIKAWGFKYSTIGFVWVKSKKDKTGFAFGTGNWTRANAEYLLIATKGSILRQDASISQIIYEPKEEHSKKPNKVRDKIVQLVGDLPRIELFARQETKGWKVWGNEI